MKNKKGFTLVEIIGVIAVLAVVTLVSVPAILRTLKKSENEKYDAFLKDIFLATETYITTNSSLFPQFSNPGGTAVVTIKTLRTEKLVKNKLTNPKKNTVVSDASGVKITVQNDKTNKYEFLETAPAADVSIGQYIINRGIVTSGDGLYQDNTLSKGYIFRGENPSNYIIFDSKCWSVMRVDTDLQTKMIYEGNATGNSCAGSRTDNSGRFDDYVWSGVVSSYSSNWYDNPTGRGRNNIRLALEKLADGEDINGYKIGNLDKIANHTWYVGAVNTFGDTQNIDTDLQQEKTNKGSNSEMVNLPVTFNGKTYSQYEWEGKIGLINATDGVKSSTSALCKSIYTSKADSNPCMYNNYLHKLGYSSWTLNADAQNINWVVQFGSLGNVGNTAPHYTEALRPVIYLKSAMKVTGLGTEASPFLLQY